MTFDFSISVKLIIGPLNEYGFIGMTGLKCPLVPKKKQRMVKPLSLSETKQGCDLSAFSFGYSKILYTTN